MQNFPEETGFVLHILVIGFHHKKGNQLEYSYPPVKVGASHDSNELPEEWHNLPNLALPDGAHNYEEDYVYFILPSLKKRDRCVFCVSCYRQIDTSKLVQRTEDMTRSSVQKSIVVICRVPLFGVIRTKLTHIAQAYFEERDFSKLEILRATYDDLHRAITKSCVETQILCSLSPRDLIARYKSKFLVLFKLLLLQRRVLFYMNPTSELCTTLLTLVSMLPGVLEDGLDHCAFIMKSRIATAAGSVGGDFVNINKSIDSDVSETDDYPPPPVLPTDLVQGEASQQPTLANSSDIISSGEPQLDNAQQTSASIGLLGSLSAGASSVFTGVRSTIFRTATSDSTKNDGDSVVEALDALPEASALQSPFITDDYGFPLPIFTESSIFHPYISLHNIEMLENEDVRSFLLGANNMLFKQKRNLIDVLVEEDDTGILIRDPVLRKQLSLTAADLRFIDSLRARVNREAIGNIYDGSDEGTLNQYKSDETSAASASSSSHPIRTNESSQPEEWEGSDEWLRQQFRDYLVGVLAAGHSTELSDWDDYNVAYVRALRETHHFKVWAAHAHSHRALQSRELVHPGHGAWQVNDVRLRMNHVLRGSEGGRKLNSAMQQTGRAVADTSKVIGDSISSAKSAVSTFWSGFSFKKSASGSSTTTTEVSSEEVNGTSVPN